MTTELVTKKVKRETCFLCRYKRDATTLCDKCERPMCKYCATTCAGGYKEDLNGIETVTSCAKAWCPTHAARVARRCYRKIAPNQFSEFRHSEFHEACAVFCSEHSTKCNLCGVATCEYHNECNRHNNDDANARMYVCDRCGKTVCADCSTQCGCERNECKQCVKPKFMMTAQDYMCKWCRDENRRGAFIDGDTSDEENGRLDKNGKFIKKPSDDGDDNVN